MEQIEDIPVPQASASQVIGSLPRLGELMRPCTTKSVRNRLLRDTTQNIVDIPTVQEVIVQSGYRNKLWRTFHWSVCNSAPSNNL